MKINWVSYLVITVAVTGILLVILGVSAPARFEFLDPYEITENIISSVVVLLIGAILFKIKLQIFENTAWRLFFASSIFMIIGNIFDIPIFPDLLWIDYMVFLLFALSLFSVIFAEFYAIKHLKNLISGKTNISRFITWLMIILGLSIPLIIGISSFYSIDITKLVFLLFDIVIFVLSMYLLSLSFKVDLFYAYSFMAFGVFFMVLANSITIILSITGTALTRFITIPWIISIALLAISADVRLNSGSINTD